MLDSFVMFLSVRVSSVRVSVEIISVRSSEMIEVLLQRLLSWIVVIVCLLCILLGFVQQLEVVTCQQQIYRVPVYTLMSKSCQRVMVSAL